MANKEKQAKNKEKIGIGAWLALIVLILVLSGAFRTAEGPIKVLDFTNLAGSFGQIGDTGANLIGKGGTGAKDGFMAGFNLIPAVMFFCGLLGVFEQLGAFKASDVLFRPLLRPLLGIPGKCGIAFISSFTGSDVAAVMTRALQCSVLRRRCACSDLPGGTRSVHRHHVRLQADRREHRPVDPSHEGQKSIRRANYECRSKNSSSPSAGSPEKKPKKPSVVDTFLKGCAKGLQGRH